MICHPGKPPADEAGLHRQWDPDSIEGIRSHSLRLSLAREFRTAGGAGLPLGQTIDLVVVNQQRQINVAPDRRQEVVCSPSIYESISTLDYHFEVGICDLCPGGNRQSSPVQAVEDIHVHVARSFGRLANG